MEAFDPATVFSSIDTGGRYAYGNQPVVAEWNLARFAETLLPLLAEDQESAVALATESLGLFRERYSAAWSAGLRAKLGLPDGVPDKAAAELGDDLVELLRASHVDWTSGFRALGPAARGDTAPLRGMFLDLAAIDDWLARWRALDPDPGLLDRTNPVYVPRNHLVEEALDAATAGDLQPLERLVDVVQHPFEERPGLERYAAPAPEDFGRYTTYCGT
jgi:serine/tyrosine/threonine adenylyltransferase